MRPKKKARPRPASEKANPSPAKPPAVATDEEARSRELALAATVPTFPDRVPLLAFRTDVVFPQTVVPLIVNRSGGIKLVDDVLSGDKSVGLVTQKNPEVDDPTINDLYPTICVGSKYGTLKMKRSLCF